MLIWSIFIISFIFLVYIYLLYPIALAFFDKNTCLEAVNGKPRLGKNKIAIIVPAHNEEDVIAKKIENHLRLDCPYNDNYIIVVIADSCTDHTAEIVNRYVGKYQDRVILKVVNDNKGKTNAINKVVPHIHADILIFSDANVYLEKDVLKHVLGNFANDNVGGVAGQLTYVNEGKSGAAHSNGIYWRYEEEIKRRESNAGSIMGADGSIFAIRKCLFRILPEHVLDDFCTSMGILEQGYVLKFDDRIKAYEKGAENKKEEFSRKVRISNRSYNSYRFMRPMLFKSLKIFDLWKFYSHKVLRWYSFIFMLMMFAAHFYIAILMAGNGIIVAAFWLHCVFYMIGILYGFFEVAGVLGRIFNIIHYFVMSNAAAFLGVIQSLWGIKTVVWRKAKSAR